MIDVCVPFVRLEVTSVDDPLAGVGVVLYAAGCPRRCPGCHNPELQATHGHTFVTVDTVVNYLERYFTKNVEATTLIEAVVFQGGDWSEYPEAYCELAGWARGKGFRTVLYTGELFENLPEGVRRASDWVVDGPWDQDKVSTFPPSSNQRVFRQGQRVDPEQLPLFKHLLDVGSQGTEQGGG